MKLKRKLLVLTALGLSMTLFLTACGKKGEEVKEDVKEGVEEVEEGASDLKENAEEKVEELSDKEKEQKLELETVVFVEEIIKEDFKNVKLEDHKISGRLGAPEELYIADLFLYIDVENKEEAEELIKTYSKILTDKLYAEYKYEEVVLNWTSPNHDKDHAIEVEDYQG